ncbi:sensor histidine kinase [Leucobacter sp. BZR 635]
MDTDWWVRLRAQPARRNTLIALFWLGLGVVLWAFGVRGLWQLVALFGAPPWAFLVTLGAIAPLVLLRTRRPFLGLALGAVIAIVDTLMGASLGVVLIFTDLVYAAIKYGSERGVRILTRVAGIAGLGLVLALFGIVPRDPGLAVLLVQWALIVLVSGLWGWNVRAERARTRTELAARHADENRELRTRIAHDLHDLVANQIAVAGLHIEAAKLQSAKLGNDHGPLTLSLDRAKLGTERAHRELRGLISVLTVVDGTDGREPVRVTEALQQLGQLMPAGRAIRWHDGAAARIGEALSHAQASRATIVVRVLQELVANAAQHGIGDLAVSAERDDVQQLRVTLMNAVSADSAPERPGGGLGVAGTGVLLTSLGGELDSRETPTGWRATLTLPLHDPTGRSTT